MKKEDLIKENFANMKVEFLSNHHNICRKIDAIFAKEVEHFKNLFDSFNNEYGCLEEKDSISVCKHLENIFNSCKVILIDDLKAKFDKNIDTLISTMYDFFIKKLTNDKARCPTKEINKYLVDMCKFNCFIILNELEDSLIDFTNEFTYHYINCEEERRDFDYLVNNVGHSLKCELKKAISTSIEDSQDITMRYNSLNKELFNMMIPR